MSCNDCVVTPSAIARAFSNALWTSFSRSLILVATGLLASEIGIGTRYLAHCGPVRPVPQAKITQVIETAPASLHQIGNCTQINIYRRTKVTLFRYKPISN
jgi:hypothetical protein